MTILTASVWPSNAELIEDVAELGYLEGRVLDTTYGNGVFWKNWQPEELVACDLNPMKSPIGKSVDFRDLPFPSRSFDSVVIDGPYKLNGTPDEKADEPYGVHLPVKWEDRMKLICEGITECARVSRGFVLVKCMDQVAQHHKRWQTLTFTVHAMQHRLLLTDRFDMLGKPREQPGDRPQRHTHINYSTLLIFRKTK